MKYKLLIHDEQRMGKSVFKFEDPKMRVLPCSIAIATFVLGQFTAEKVYAEAKKTIRERIIDTLVEKRFSQWVQHPEIISAINAQNKKNAALGQADIDRLDKQWRAERKADSKPLIDEVLGNSVSQHLKTIKAGAPKLYTEIFVMDNRGLNVGQSDVTSDYWQGDESKFKKTYDVGPNVTFIDDYEIDESTGKMPSPDQSVDLRPGYG